MSQVLVKKVCPKCHEDLEYNYAYGIDECVNCGYTNGSCD
jgi:ribosomal protein L37AE/L43A